MNDLRERFRALDALDVPDVLSRARLIGPKPPEPDPTPPLRRAGALAFAAVVAILAVFLITRALEQARPPVQPIQPSPSERPVQRPPVEVTFPMFPDGVQPSTPVTGEAVLEFRSWPSDGFPVEVAVYADGRVIWHPDDEDVGYFEFRLTAEGVDTIRSIVVSTGLFDHDLALRRVGTTLSRLELRRGDRSVFVQWGLPGYTGGRDNPEATAAQAEALHELERFLGDPTAWALPSDQYADPEISDFVPFGFQFTYDRSEPDLSQIPSPAREVLASHLPERACVIISTEQAREIVETLAQAGFAPLTNTPTYVDFGIPGLPGPSNPHLSVALPHAVGCLIDGDGSDG
jgi:hypothetical protein